MINTCTPLAMTIINIAVLQVAVFAAIGVVGGVSYWLGKNSNRWGF